MEIIVFNRKNNTANSIADFMDFYYSMRMKYLASDLLKEGLSPRQISIAVLKAINSGKSSGMNIAQHFKPVFSGIGGEIVSDCKLSKLAYGLVLMNADTELPKVGGFQVSILQKYFTNSVAY